MSKRQLIHTLLLLSTIVLGEVYQLFHTAELRLVDWFVFSDMQQDVEWYIKDTCEKLTFIVLLMVWHSREKSKVFRKVLLGLIVYRLLDLIMYYMNFNETTAIYAGIYIFVGLLISYSIITSYRTGCKLK